MTEKFELIGRKYEDDERIKINAGLEKFKKEGMEKLPEELEKTEEMKKMLDAVRKVLGNELARRNISGPVLSPNEKIHILSAENYEKMSPDTYAHYSPIDDAIYTSETIFNDRPRALYLLLHEMFHDVSTKKYYADDDWKVSDSRSGYSINPKWKEKERNNRLSGWNELMTDCAAYFAMKRNEEFIGQNLGITKEEMSRPLYAYFKFLPIINVIVPKLAEAKKCLPTEIIDRLTGGMFSDNLFVLKDIGKCFGKESVEILSLFHSTKEDSDNEKIAEMYKKYFEEPDKEKRRTRGEEIKTFIQTVDETKN